MIQITFPNGKHAEYTTLGAISLLVQGFFCYPDCVYFFTDHSGVSADGEFSMTLERLRENRSGKIELMTFMASGHEALLLSSFFARLVHGYEGERTKVAMMLMAGIWKENDLDAGLLTHSLEQLAFFIEASQKKCLGLHVFIQPGV